MGARPRLLEHPQSDVPPGEHPRITTLARHLQNPSSAPRFGAAVGIAPTKRRIDCGQRKHRAQPRHSGLGQNGFARLRLRLGDSGAR